MGLSEAIPMAKIATRPQAKKTNTVPDRTAEIQRLAYQFFLERGQEHGHDQEDWARAEAIVKNRKN
jgi:hypothetical protein